MNKALMIGLVAGALAIGGAITFVACKHEPKDKDDPVSTGAETSGTNPEGGTVSASFHYSIKNSSPIEMTVTVDGKDITIPAGETITGSYKFSVVIGSEIFKDKDVSYD